MESELSRVRYEIENYTGTLKRLEQMVNFSLIHVDVYEVKEIKVTEPDPDTLGERIVGHLKIPNRHWNVFRESNHFPSGSLTISDFADSHRLGNMVTWSKTCC